MDLSKITEDLAKGTTSHLSTLATELSSTSPAYLLANYSVTTDVELMYEKLAKSIAEFEEKLDATQEVAVPREFRVSANSPR